jgi:transcription elongation factor GreA
VTGRGAAALLAAVGLLPDGPLPWGRPVPARGPGIYVVELPAPLPAAPVELTRVGKWIERVETLRLDGARPTSKALAARLASFWLPDELVIYVGMTTVSLGRRVAALYDTPLGDRRPHSGGHWLKTLRELDHLRIWWAATDAAEEYEDAILTAFAERVGAEARRALPDASVVLPFANLQTATGERKQHGISGAILVGPEEPPPPPTRVVDVPPGDADGAAVEVKGSGTTRRTGSPASLGRAPRPPRPAKAVSSGTAGQRRAAGPSKAPSAARAEPIDLTADALERMRAEVRELTHVRRPEVVARIKAARELGDLRENAEYHAAREEQSFLEGRVRMLEERIRNARVIDAAWTPHVTIGSTVTVEHDGEVLTFSIVGSTEADPARGRISDASPVGAALLGHAPGDEVDVRTPRGSAHYRVISLD